MKRALWNCVGLAMVCLAGSLYAWPRVEEVVPIHWGSDGQPNGYGSRAVGLLLLPAIVLLQPIVMAAVTRLDPRREHVERSSMALGWTVVGISGLLTYVHLLIVRALLSDGTMPATALLVGTGAFFMLLGNVLPKIRSNSWTGIRTPWTLTSERVWHRTHRLGGILMAVSGMVIIAAALAWSAPAAFAVMMVGAMLSGLVPAAMSYVYWKQEPPTA